MRLNHWLFTYRNQTADPPSPPCPSCGSSETVLGIPDSPEAETHRCPACSHQWSIPTGIASAGLPEWGGSRVSTELLLKLTAKEH